MKLKKIWRVLKKKRRLKKLSQTNTIQIAKKDISRFDLHIEGQNNTIIFPQNFGGEGSIYINIYGNNNTIILQEGCSVGNSLVIEMGHNHPNFGAVNNASVRVGEYTSFESTVYSTFNSNSYCHIGKKCMFSLDINLYNTDAHPVLDINTKEVVNKVKGIEIGNHCWIGRGVTILKNTKLAEDCIVGWGSVIAGDKSKKPHCVYAGNPARLVKENVTWDSNGAKWKYNKN